MYLVLLTYSFPPMTGGIAVFMEQFARNLPNDTITVICPPFPGHEEFDRRQPYQIRRLPLMGDPTRIEQRFKFLGGAYYRALSRCSGVDAVICGQTHHTLMLPSWIYAKRHQLPFAVFSHGNDLFHAQGRVHTPLTNFLLQRADIVFANSQRTAMEAAAIGVTSRRIFVTPPGVNIDKMSEENGADHLASLAQTYEGKRIILTVGRLVERKGHDIVIQAMPKILSEIPNAHYLIVGTGPQEEHLRALAIQTGVENHVEFCGFVPDCRLRAYYDLCNVFALISREEASGRDYEGFGIVFLEANYAGKPVVAGRSGGIEDAVIDSQTGLLVAPNNPSAVAEKLIQILTDTRLAKTLGARGRMRAEAEFTEKIVASRCAEVIAQAATKKERS